MEEDWKGEFRAEILEDMKKEARQELAEEMARIYLETTDYDDERISERFGVPIYKVEQFREDHKKWQFAKQLKITEEPALLEDDVVSLCLPKDMYLKKGKLDGAENMLLLGLHATGLQGFIELISVDTREMLRKMLNEQDLDAKEKEEGMNYYQMLENLHVVSNKKERADMNFWAQEMYSSTDFSDACLDIHLLLRKGFCTYVERAEEKIE